MKKNIILSFVFALAFAFVSFGQDMDFSGESMPAAMPQDMSPENYFLITSYSIHYTKLYDSSGNLSFHRRTVR